MWLLLTAMSDIRISLLRLNTHDMSCDEPEFSAHTRTLPRLVRTNSLRS